MFFGASKDIEIDQVGIEVDTKTHFQMFDWICNPLSCSIQNNFQYKISSQINKSIRLLKSNWFEMSKISENLVFTPKLK